MIGLVRELVRRVEDLKQRVKWSDQLENALNALKEELSKSGSQGP